MIVKVVLRFALALMVFEGARVHTANAATPANNEGRPVRFTAKRRCQIFTYQPGGSPLWLKSGERLALGERILGKVVTRKERLVLFKKDQRVRATHIDCFEGAQDRFTWRAVRGYFSLGLLSWQESLSGVYKGVSYPLLGAGAGVCAGGGGEIRRGRWDLGLSLCGGLAKTQISQSSAVIDGLSVDVRNASAWIGVLSPAALWRPASENVALGVSLPLVVRWQSGDLGSVQMSPALSIFPSLLFEARLERAPFALSQKLGFFRALNRYLWLIELQYHL